MNYLITILIILVAIIIFGIIIYLLFFNKNTIPESLSYAYITDIVPTTDLTYKELETTPLLKHHTLPDGTKLLACNESAFPKRWPIVKDISDPKTSTVVSIPLFRATGSPSVEDVGTDWSLSISRAADELLWIAGLIPNKQYTISFNDLAFSYRSDDQGIIFPSDIPLPTAAIPYNDMRLNSEGNPAYSKESPAVISYPTSLPKGDISFINQDNTTTLVFENDPMLVCKNPTKEVFGVYRKVSNERRKNIAKQPIYFNILATAFYPKEINKPQRFKNVKVPVFVKDGSLQRVMN